MIPPRILKDPLLHFLAAGLLLFLIGGALKPAAPDAARIVVDRAALLDFVQYRSKAFEPSAAAAILDGLDAEERQQIIRDFVREEALAREAKTLGLDANDYVIRQRMVQKVEFLAEATAVTAPPTDAGIAAYYDAHRERYTSPASATLTHVFVSAEGTTAEGTRERAEKLLQTLKAARAAFNDATQYGDRFLFHKNYVDRTDDYIESQLGPEVKQAVFDDGTALNDWRGPYRSPYGDHLIFVTARAPARLASLAEIVDLVASDLAEENRQKAIDAAIDEIVARYAVEVRVDDPK